MESSNHGWPLLQCRRNLSSLAHFTFPIPNGWGTDTFPHLSGQCGGIGCCVHGHKRLKSNNNGSHILILISVNLIAFPPDAYICSSDQNEDMAQTRRMRMAPPPTKGHSLSRPHQARKRVLFIQVRSLTTPNPSVADNSHNTTMWGSVILKKKLRSFLWTDHQSIILISPSSIWKRLKKQVSSPHYACIEENLHSIGSHVDI